VVPSDELKLVEKTFALLDSNTYEQALELIDERFEMVTTAEVASEPDVYRGPDGVRRWWESFLEAMDYVGLEAGRFHEVGDGRVIVEFVIRARGSRSGIEAEQPANALATVDRGKLVRLEFFTSLELAREAAGLPPR
jgi:ketosteroid isomerase-like protein